ncbi:hypothetical protein [Bradyrhizobium sp. OAE829]|uniref:hypothetical protein n=1 Tax=Bradyrhizobium sp. OAE829 TaxID=2663807 RepID=UPI00178A28C5
MIDWTTFPVRDGLTALALIVAGLSLYISWSTARQTRAEKSVNAWITLARLNTEWWIATLNVKNASPLGIQIEKLGVDPPDYRLAHLSEGNAEGTSLDLSIMVQGFALAFDLNVPPGETLERKFLLYQPAHSRRISTNVTVMYWTLEAKQRWVLLRVKVQTRSNL